MLIFGHKMFVPNWGHLPHRGGNTLTPCQPHPPRISKFGTAETGRNFGSLPHHVYSGIIAMKFWSHPVIENLQLFFPCDDCDVVNIKMLKNKNSTSIFVAPTVFRVHGSCRMVYYFWRISGMFWRENRFFTANKPYSTSSTNRSVTKPTWITTSC